MKPKAKDSKPKSYYYYGFTLKSALLAQSDISIKPLRGFTLIELLITIAIVGIISAFVIYGMGNYLQRGRDQTRKSELAQLQQALTLYYNDNNSYPCADGAYFVGSLSGCGLTSSYIKQIPHDERAPSDDCNTQFSDYAVEIKNSRQDYQFHARLENNNDPAVIAPYSLTISGKSCTYNYNKAINP